MTVPGMQRLSIIVPVLNEAELITQTLGALQELRRQGHEVIIVDGGSKDETLAIAMPLADRVLRSAPGRAVQMNHAAESAQGDVLVFLHVDTRLPAHCDRLVNEALGTGCRVWGRFDLRLSGQHPLLRVVERMMNLRSCLTGIATGDQCIFVKRTVFQLAGGYPAIALMEDIALSRRLKGFSRPLCIKTAVVSSSRRWESQGILRTILLMWCLRLAYLLGVKTDKLARIYYK